MRGATPCAYKALNMLLLLCFMGLLSLSECLHGWAERFPIYATLGGREPMLWRGSVFMHGAVLCGSSLVSIEFFGGVVAPRAGYLLLASISFVSKAQRLISLIVPLRTMKSKINDGVLEYPTEDYLMVIDGRMKGCSTCPRFGTISNPNRLCLGRSV